MSSTITRLLDVIVQLAANFVMFNKPSPSLLTMRKDLASKVAYRISCVQLFLQQLQPLRQLAGDAIGLVIH